MRSRSTLFAIPAVIASLVAPAAASGASTIGAVFAPTGGFDAEAPVTLVQTASFDNQYMAPAAGVLTSWSFQSSVSEAAGIRLKVARNNGSGYVVVGESAPETIPGSSTRNFLTRISVKGGDVIGLFVPDGSAVAKDGVGYTVSQASGDVPAGSPTVLGSPISGVQLDISASLEPDVDRDGFGDETQDQCPQETAAQVAPCDATPPQTTITNDPPARTKKSTVTYKFRSNEERSTFQCKVDRKPWKSCRSPKRLKRLDEGRHRFKVRATDVTGNVDPTPAKDKFRVID